MYTVTGSKKAATNKDSHTSSITPDMSKVCSIILAGGQGTRLFPLTKKRCKPAIVFGGRYFLIDVPISNSLNAHIRYNFIVTQFLSSSLHQHIFQTFGNPHFPNGSVEILCAEQKPDRCNWYKGTADSIRQNLEYLTDIPAEYFLILSGDQLYRMDFKKMVQYAMQKDVDVLVATLAVNEKEAKRMGIMKVNEDNHIIDFHEKPQEDMTLAKLKTPNSVQEMMGLPQGTDKQFLGSMGIYLFRRNALLKLLVEDPRDDFGKHLIPTQVARGSIAAFPHTDYWEDIGTIEAFYNANMALTESHPPFNCHDEKYPIHTLRLDLPGPKISSTHVENSILCEGSIIEADTISKSIIGQKARLKKGTIVKASYIMGNDSYTPHIRDIDQPDEYTIGEDCLISNAIIDRNVSIGNCVQLINKNGLVEYNGPGIYIRDSIIVVPRGTIIPEGFVL